MTLLLGCIADDFTGATDLANTLVKAGMRTIQLLGVPAVGLEVPDADCIIIALKSRREGSGRGGAHVGRITHLREADSDLFHCGA